MQHAIMLPITVHYSRINRQILNSMTLKKELADVTVRY